MAESSFAKEIGEALRQLWNTTGSALTGIGTFQSGTRIEPDDTVDPLDSALAGLAGLVAKMRESEGVAFAGSGLVMGSEQSQANVRDFLSGFTGSDLSGFSSPTQQTTEGFKEVGGKAVVSDTKADPFAGGSISALVELFTAAERRIYQQLDAQAAQGYLAGKATELRRRVQRGGPPTDLAGALERAQGGGDPFADFLSGLLDSLGGGGGGGGGGAGRIYQAPDRNAVRDQVRLMMVALIGKGDDALIEQLTDQFLADDRARVMDNAAVDPAQTVRDRIRQTEAYGRIHKLRPESVAEEDWLPAYRQVLMAAGIPMATIDDLAIKFAQSAANPATFTETGFGVRQLSQSGTARPSLTQGASQIGRALGSLIK